MDKTDIKTIKEIELKSLIPNSLNNRSKILIILAILVAIVFIYIVSKRKGWLKLKKPSKKNKRKSILDDNDEEEIDDLILNIKNKQN